MTEAGAASFGVDEVVVWLRAHGNERARESVREALQDDVTSVLGTTARLRPGVYALRRPGRGPGRANADARRHCADALLEAADRLLGDGPPEVTRAQVVAEMGAAGALFSARAITAGLARLLSSGRLARTGHGRYRRAGAA